MPLGFYPIPAGARLPEGGAEEVGNKSWNLMRMAASGLPVPPGFVLPTGWCRARSRNGVDEIALQATLAAGIGSLEVATNLGFGAARRPLLVSVRSGAAVSMPGMLETVPERRPEHADSGRLDLPHRQSATGLGQLSPPRSGLCRSGGSAACSLVRCSGERDRR